MDYPVAWIAENRAFGDLIASADPTLPVPTCPDWTLQQLFRHVGRGDRWAAQIVVDRATEAVDPRTVPEGKPPPDPDGAMAWLHGGAHNLLDAVEQVGPQTPVWTFIGPRPAAWWIRRRLHEATVHRADAAIALGVDYQLDAELAADGISEWLDLFAARAQPPDLPLTDGQTLHLHATDAGLGPEGEWTLRGDATGISWAHEHGKASVALRGAATDLFLATARRIPVDGDAGIAVLGDRGVWDGWLDRTAF